MRHFGVGSPYTSIEYHHRHSIWRVARVMGLQQVLAPSLGAEAHLMGSMRMVMRLDGSSMCSVLSVTLTVPPSSTAATSVSRGPTFARPYLHAWLMHARHCHTFVCCLTCQAQN
jgi:hypothetical protein